MAITQTGKDAEAAQRSLANRTVTNPYLTEEKKKLGAIPTTRNVNILGQQLTVPMGSGIDRFRAIANAPVTTTQSGGDLVQAPNQAALQAATENVAGQKYQTPEQAAGYIKSLQASLGVKSPEASSQAIRDAATESLQESAHRQAVSDASGLASRGLGDSAIGAALAQSRGTRLAGEKTQAMAGIDLADQSRMDAYNRQLMGDAMQTGAQQSQFGAQVAGQGLQAQQAMADDEFRRKQAAYQAQLDQINQANAADLAAIQKRQANISAGLGFAGAALGAGAQLGSAGIAK